VAETKGGAVVSVEFLEFSDRVVRVEITPDGEGFIRRTMTAEVVSGPPFTLEEYEAISAAVVADMISRGCDVCRWGGIPEDSE